MYEIDFSIFAIYLKQIILGIGTTFYICVVSSVLAFLFGSVLFFFRWNENIVLKNTAVCFVEFIRNTPLLIQLYILYRGLPQFNIVMPAELCGVLALSVYTGVYISENLRSGANSIQEQQKNASFALGLSDFQTFVYIIYPQALRNVILPLGSQFINLIKNSTLVSFIAVTDIFYTFQQGVADSLRIVEFMIMGITLYATMVLTVALITNILDTHYKIKNTEAV